MALDKAKIFVAGHKGLVGSALHRCLAAGGFNTILTREHSQLDLLDSSKVADFFAAERPEYVFLSAAKVGGIHGNSSYPADFLLENLKIQNNIIESAWRYGVKKLLFLGSSCIYPKLAPQPIPESALLSGVLEPTNEAYAVAKIAGIKLCNAYNKQYGTDFLCVMPCNLYGLNDNYHPENAHALPMLLRRFHEAMIVREPIVTVWGTGTPRREFMFADDLAEACVFLMDKYSAKEAGDLVNIGTGEDCTILELAEMIREVVGYQGVIELDPSKADGTPRKLLDVTKIHSLGWHHRTSLREGLERTYRNFLENGALRK